MILPMAKIRILGLRDDLERTVQIILDLGLLHLARLQPKTEALRPVEHAPVQQRRQRYVHDTLADIDVIVELLSCTLLRERPSAPRPTPRDWNHWVHVARRTRRSLERTKEHRQDLDKERSRLVHFVRFADTFEDMARAVGELTGQSAYSLVVPHTDVAALRIQMKATLGQAVEVHTRPLDSGDVAVLLLVPEDREQAIEHLLSDSGVLDLRLPLDCKSSSLRRAAPQMLERIEAIDEEIGEIETRRAETAMQLSAELARAKGAMEDWLRELEAMTRAAETRRSFVIEGWVPESSVAEVRQRIESSLGDMVAVEQVAEEEWEGEDAPVVLHNPGIFEPFEQITRMVPLPRYGTIDPTPFVGVFFPVFFGLILGDVGYAAVLLAISVVVRRQAKPDSRRQGIARIGTVCGFFTFAFGLAYGELFGDLGRHYLGMRPLLLDREEALLPFLGLTVAIGFVHVLLGLILGIVTGAHGPARHTVGRGLAAVMVLLIAVALMAAVDHLPAKLLTPVVVSILIVFPILIILEGIIAPIELLSTFSNILSYARIMALGTASVMMAVVANRLAGAMGSVLVGTLFALLFHLVNFVLGVFAPTIHSLRLHYVEFFGKFVSPGGIRYDPLRHWQPGDELAG